MRLSKKQFAFVVITLGILLATAFMLGTATGIAAARRGQPSTADSKLGDRVADKPLSQVLGYLSPAALLAAACNNSEHKFDVTRSDIFKYQGWLDDGCRNYKEGGNEDGQAIMARLLVELGAKLNGYSEPTPFIDLTRSVLFLPPDPSSRGERPSIFSVLAYYESNRINGMGHQSAWEKTKIQVAGDMETHPES